MADMSEERTIPSILLDHEKRLSTVEEAESNVEKRMDRFELKLDKLYWVGWLIVLTVVGSTIATHVHF